MEYEVIYVLWDITHKCSLRCKHCRADKPFVCGELDTKDAKKVLDQLGEIGIKTLAISGGDPFLRRDLSEIVDYATKKGIRVRIQTNGQMVNDDILTNLRKAGCDEFGIGLDSSNSEYHDWLRNKKGVFDKTIEAIKQIKSHGFKVHIEFTLNPKNKKDIDKVIELCKSLKADTFFSRCVIPFGKGEDPSLAIPNEEYAQLLKKIANKKYENNELKIGSEDPLWILADGKLLNRVLKKYPKATEGEFLSGCLAGINMFYINPLGKVYPCSFLDIELGDLKKESLKKIWSERKEKIAFLNRDALKGKCGECDLRYLCGGCRARAFAAFGDYLEADPKCPFVEKHNLDEFGERIK